MAVRVLPLLEEAESPRSNATPPGKGSPLGQVMRGAPGSRVRPAHARRPSFLGPKRTNRADGAPDRRPSFLGGRASRRSSRRSSLGSYELGRVGKAENMWELPKPLNAAERLLRTHLSRVTDDAVSIAGRVDAKYTASYATEVSTTPHYGADGETTQRFLAGATTRRAVTPARRSESSDEDSEDVFNRRLAANTYDKFAARRAQRFATARGRAKRNFLKQEERRNAAESRVSTKVALRRMRAREAERCHQKELELATHGPPRELTLEDQKDEVSRKLQDMQATYEKCARRHRKKDAKAVTRIQRCWRGYAGRRRTGDACFKARFVTGFFQTNDVESEEDEESFDPELYDRVCATIQRAWKRYRVRMRRRYFYAARLAMLWRARRNLRLRKEKAAFLKKGRKESSKRFVRCVRRFLSRKLGEWRVAASERRRAKWNLRRAQAFIAIKRGLEGYYRNRARKERVINSLRQSGAPEVQGAVATFLVDNDWPRCIDALHGGLHDSDDEADDDEDDADVVEGTRFAACAPSVAEFRSLPFGDDRLLPSAFWDLVTHVSDRTLFKQRRRVERRHQQKEAEARALVASFVRGLRRDAFDATADTNSVVGHLPDDADLWRVPSMDRASTIRARTVFDEKAPIQEGAGYKLRWVWDGELCDACGAIVPDFLRARTCRTCGSRTPLAADRPTLAFQPAVAPKLPSKALDVTSERATTFLVHARLLDLAGAPGSGWRRRRVPLAQLWRAAVASTCDARSELRGLAVGSIADLHARGGAAKLLSPAHGDLGMKADGLLEVLDGALQQREAGARKADARRAVREG